MKEQTFEVTVKTNTAHGVHVKQIGEAVEQIDGVSVVKVRDGDRGIAWQAAVRPGRGL